MDRITDYAERGRALLISQYQEKPRLAAFLTALLNRTQEREDATFDVLNKRLLVNAEAAQLDTIGRIVGQPRNGQTDDVYKLYVAARIIINRSKGRRGALLRVLRTIEAARFFYSELYPATSVVHYVEEPATSTAVLFDLAQQALAGGVRLIFYFDTDGARAFRFGDVGDPTFNESVGFGDEGDDAIGGLLEDVMET